MAPPNLTREQAQHRAELLRVQSYVVELDLSGGDGSDVETFGSTTTVRFSSDQVGAETWIDLIATRVHRAVLNGVELDLTDYDESTGIRLPDLATENELHVHADCYYTNTGEGLHRFVDPVDGSTYLYSQFETADAKRMFSCFDQPDLKATYQLTVHAPSSWKVISNAAVERTANNPNGTLRHVLATSRPMSTYLVALVAGPYAEWRDVFHGEEGDIPLGLYCRSSLAEHFDPERLFTETKQGFEFYHRAFGVAYPFGKYDQCFVPEFNAGAMENAGCITFREDYVFRSKVTGYFYERRAETILHEMAHMWFGDLVTMRWWDDLWLNESFATWASVLCQVNATQYTHAWTTFANVEKSWAYRQDQLPSTHPVAADITDLQAVEVNFDGITYAKGASVLKQLVAYVGLENFLAGLQVYFNRHAWSNATLSDLLSALEESSGRDLSWWSAQWLETTGLNTLRPVFETDDAGRFTSFAVEQHGAQPGAGELRTHRLAVGIYDDDNGELVRTQRVEIDVSGAHTDVPELRGVHRGQLVLVNDDDLTYCSLRLDPESLNTLVGRIADLRESLPRALCWSTAWEMTRDAEMRARDFVDLVVGTSPNSGIGAEAEVGVVQRVLLQAQTALASYVDPSAQADRWHSFTQRLFELAHRAEPGSDHQLAFVTALTGSVLDDKQLAVLRGWLTESAPLPGLRVDTDLQWQLLQALVAHDIAGEAEIDTHLEHDPTATGQRRAERARALIPTAENKRRAWQRAVHDDELPNAINEAIITGFSHPNQRALIADYVDTYFAEIDEVWQRRSSERAQPTVIGLFPSWLISDYTVQAADQWLAGEHPAALRRLVTEGRAAVVRALAAREFDRT